MAATAALISFESSCNGLGGGSLDLPFFEDGVHTATIASIGSGENSVSDKMAVAFLFKIIINCIYL